jgi:CHAD domain-containing protein
MTKAKEITGLDCNADVLDGVALVLRARFEEARTLREAALDWSDIEGVHDMRVATRRLRSALRDFLPLIEKRSLKSARKELKKIADALGAVRDQDVVIVALEALKEEAEQEEIKRGVEKLIEERFIVRNKARACLLETIALESLSRLQENFTGAIEEAIKIKREDTERKNQSSNISFRQAGSGVIASSLKEFLKLGWRIYEPFNIKALHNLRIAAKRLRYAIELFASCWGEEIHSFAHEIAEMQLSLGEAHDCDVWIEGLVQRLQDKKSGRDALQDNQAIVWLLSHFVKMRTKHYRAALERWNEWQRNNFAENLLAICSISSLG